MGKLTATDIVTEVKSSKGGATTIKALHALDPAMRHDVTAALKDAVRQGTLKLGKGGTVQHVADTKEMYAKKAADAARTEKMQAQLKADRATMNAAFGKGGAFDKANKIAKHAPAPQGPQTKPTSHGPVHVDGKHSAHPVAAAQAHAAHAAAIESAKKSGHTVTHHHPTYGPVMKGPKGGSYVVHNGKKYYGNY